MNVLNILVWLRAVLWIRMFFFKKGIRLRLLTLSGSGLDCYRDPDPDRIIEKFLYAYSLWVSGSSFEIDKNMNPGMDLPWKFILKKFTKKGRLVKKMTSNLKGNPYGKTQFDLRTRIQKTKLPESGSTAPRLRTRRKHKVNWCPVL